MFVAHRDRAWGKVRRSDMFNAPPHCAPLELVVPRNPAAIDISALRAFTQAASRSARTSVMNPKESPVRPSAKRLEIQSRPCILWRQGGPQDRPPGHPK